MTEAAELPTAERLQAHSRASATSTMAAASGTGLQAAAAERRCTLCGTRTSSSNKWRKHPVTGVRLSAMHAVSDAPSAQQT